MMSGPVQKPVEYIQGAPIYESDIVAPLVMKGTDISSDAIRAKLLEMRTKELNLRRMLIPSKFDLLIL